VKVSHHQLLSPYTGRVGIGTTQPEANLHIVGDVHKLPVWVQSQGGNALWVTGGRTELRATKGTVLSVHADRADANAPPATAEFFPFSGTGRVGIGLSSSPGAALDVLYDGNDVPQLRLQSSSADTFLSLKSNNAGGREYWLDSGGTGAGVGAGNLAVWDPAAHAARLVISADGNVGIGTVAPQAKLHVQGDMIATGNIIAYSDIVLQNADCAEEFAVKDVELIEPGTVMVLGEEGSLCQSTQAYDKKVAGVISGAGDFKPGLVLDKQAGSTGRLALSLMGKAYCKVDAQYAAIEVGDLLTTSPTAGHAMKANDPLRAFGATIGKALRPLAEGKGLIPILVALQ
jgi:hypothetical protein